MLRRLEQQIAATEIAVDTHYLDAQRHEDNARRIEQDRDDQRRREE